MAAPELGRWEPLDLQAVVDAFSSASFRWWISGGHALELHLDRSWRAHDDVDVGVRRVDAPSVRGLLPDWHFSIAAAGQLSPWDGTVPDADLHQNNIWCRLQPDGPWVLDLTLGDGSDTHWVYRRDPSVTVAWEHAVLRSAAGIPYLAPELQLLFKSKDPRPKDHLDATGVIPRLEPPRRQFLDGVLARDHPWRSHLH